MSGVRVEEGKVELERIVLAQVGGEATVLEAIIEHSEAASHDQLRIRLVGETEPGRKVVLLPLSQALPKFARHKLNAVQCEQINEAWREIASVRSARNQVGRAARRRTVRNEVRLVSMVFIDRLEIIPAQA